MLFSQALCVLAVLTGAEGAQWRQAARDDGITVYSRQREGDEVAEMKAVGIIDATPHEVWRALRDYPSYPTTMPYTEYAKVLGVEDGGRVTYFHSVVNAPFIARRDYVIKLLDESDWRDGKGFLKVSWTPAKMGPPPKEGVVRLEVNEGYWLLEPRENGQKTFATYYVRTDPGGAIPKWLVNKANSTGVPDVFRAIRKVVQANRGVGGAGH